MKLDIATIWLDGCSGCHMSFLDMDERLVALAAHMNVVYSPYVDTKVFPSGVDLTIVEGALSTDHDLEMIKTIRQNSKHVLALGDCAITGNVSTMKNLYGTRAVLEAGYEQNADYNKGCFPHEVVPKLLDRVYPLHEIIDVDFFIPGCPTPADAIYETLCDLLEGKTPHPMNLTRFGK
ncbi:MAG: NADP oxidoreductase [Campylobacterota bacterium]